MDFRGLKKNTVVANRRGVCKRNSGVSQLIFYALALGDAGGPIVRTSLSARLTRRKRAV
jgi:hypothetical protein